MLLYKEAYMKRNHIVLLTGAVLITILMGSCDALFANQFKAAGLGQPTAEQLATQAQSTDPAVSQPALALQVEAQLEAGGATPLINNLVNVLIDQGSSLGTLADSGATMNSFIAALVPAETLATPGGLASAIDAIAGSLPDLTALAGSVEGDSFAASGLNAQNLAMTAALATVFSNLEPTTPGSSVGTELEAYYVASAAATASGDPVPNISGYVTVPVGVDLSALLGAGSTVDTLLQVAGIDLSSFTS